MKNDKYLIGEAMVVHPDNGLPARLTVVYFPPEETESEKGPPQPRILVEIWQDGSSDGTTQCPKAMLDHRPYSRHEQAVGGVARESFEQQPPGWFERQCAAANCFWFVPFVKCMADGKNVPLKEIQASYRAYNGGKEMAFGALGTPFRQTGNDKYSSG